MNLGDGRAKRRRPRLFVTALGVAGLTAVAVAAAVLWLPRDRGRPADPDPVTSTAPAAPAVIAGPAVIATIAVGGELTGTAIDPAAGALYVGVETPDRGHIAVIGTAERAITKNIDIDRPIGVAVDPVTRTLYVAGSHWGRNDGVSVVNPTTGVIGATIDVSGQIAVDSVGARAYVATGGDHEAARVSVVDLTSNTIIGAVTVGGEAPATVTVDPGTHTAYCANWAGKVSVIDSAAAIVDTFDVGPGPSRMLIDASTHTLYVGHSGGYHNAGDLSVVDLATRSVTAVVPVGRLVSDIAVDPDNHLAYVTNSYDATVSVIDTTTNTVTTTIAVGSSPRGVEVDPNSHLAYVAHNGKGGIRDDGTVSVISPAPQH